MRFFSWVQGVIVGLSGFVGEVSRNNQFRVTDRDFLTSHNNTVSTNTSLVADRNYYSTALLVIASGIDLQLSDMPGILNISRAYK